MNENNFTNNENNVKMSSINVNTINKKMTEN